MGIPPSELILRPDSTSFADCYRALYQMAHASGEKSSCFSFKPGSQMTPKERIQFISSCHRGYDKAQVEIARSIMALLRSDLDDDTVFWRVAVLRKLMDSIACLLLDGRIEALRRLCFLREMPPIEPEVLESTMKTIAGWNRLSRKSFAMISDLTSSVHVGDAIKINYRNPYRPMVSLIEIKSGHINEALMGDLESFTPPETGLPKVEDREDLSPSMRKQLERMLRQKTRMLRAVKGIAEEKPVLLNTGQPIIYRNAERNPFYDSALDELCTAAVANGSSSVSIDGCLHIGAAVGDTWGAAMRMAIHEATSALDRYWVSSTATQMAILDDILEQIPVEQTALFIRPFMDNVYSMGTRPFPLWCVQNAHVYKWMSGTLEVIMLLDLPGMICCARSVGLKMSLSSLKEYSRAVNKIGHPLLAEWGKRAIFLNDPEGFSPMLSGVLTKIILDLFLPSKLFASLTDPSDKRQS